MIHHCTAIDAGGGDVLTDHKRFPVFNGVPICGTAISIVEADDELAG
jgi:hypothetical protein